MIACMKKAAAVFSLGLIPVLALAQSTHGDWYVGNDNSGAPFMLTLNDSDGALGKWCDTETEKCFWMMAIQTRCETGASFPALINSDLGAVTTKLICGGPKVIDKTTYHRLVIQDFELMTRLTREGKGRIGIAIATGDGGFRVNRFSLNGSTEALAKMEQSEAEALRVKDRRSTRDRVL